MEQQDKGGHGFPVPDGPQSVWQSLHQEEERGMEMRLNADQLCAMARYRERENVWGHWIAIGVCLVAGAVFLCTAIDAEQIWARLGNVWMSFIMAAACWRGRRGARRRLAAESCAHFMVREFEGSRRTVLDIQWGIALALPAFLLFWWAGHDDLQRSWPHLDPASWRYYLVTAPWTRPTVLAVLLAGWVGFGWEAKKRAGQAEELRRAIGEVSGAGS